MRSDSSKLVAVRAVAHDAKWHAVPCDRHVIQRGYLRYATREEKDDWVVVQPVEGGRPVLGFQRVPEPKTGKNRVHLDVRVIGPLAR